MNVMVDRAAALLNPCLICLTTRIDSVVVPFAPPVMMAGRSYMRRASRVRKRIATINAGFTSGSVMCLSRCQAVTPSTLAAS